jgi:hypothetical protein
MRLLFLFFLQVSWQLSAAQSDMQALKTNLTPYKIFGRQNPFSRNIRFAGYQTSKIRRTLGSINLFGTINPFNTILRFEKIPFQYKERYRAKDVFRFTLTHDDGVTLTAECSGRLKVREAFTLLGQQDSSFWGEKNEDLFLAVIAPNNDTANKWTFFATNLNATNEKPQKGKLIRKEEELNFELKNLLLKQNVNAQSQDPSFTSMDMVYAFKYHGEIIAAVSVKEADRKFWIKDELNEGIKNVIAAAAVILTIRQNIYRQKTYL